MTPALAATIVLRREEQFSVGRIGAVPEKVPVGPRHEDLRRLLCEEVEGDRERAGTAREGDRPPALPVHRHVVAARRQRDLADQLAAFAQNCDSEIAVAAHGGREDQRLARRERRRGAWGETGGERRSGPGEQRASVDDHFSVAVERVEAGRESGPHGDVPLEQVAQTLQHDRRV